MFFASVLASYGLFMIMQQDFLPSDDTGMIQGSIQTETGTAFDQVVAYTKQIVAIVLKDPAIDSVSNYIGPGGPTATLNQGRVFIALKPKQQRAPIMTVIGRLDKAVSSVMGVRLFMQPVQDINIGGRLTATQSNTR